MKFDIEISNFGKVKKAEINIRPFTIIAGPNSSGKSFVTKALYSIFSTVNTDHVSIEAYNNINNLKRLISYLRVRIDRISQKESILIDELTLSLTLVRSSIDAAFGSNLFTEQVSNSFLLQESISSLDKSLLLLIDEIEPKKTKFAKARALIDSIAQSIKNLKEIAEEPTKFLSMGIDSGIVNALKDNFQVTNLLSLKNYHSSENDTVNFNLDTLGSLSINTTGTLNFSLNQNSIDEFQKLYNVVYLESPVYWKLKDALDLVRKDNLFSFHRKRNVSKNSLTGVPKHFYDLLDLLESKVKSTNEANISSQLIRDAIGGEIDISDSGDISFKEQSSSSNVNLHSTALGITNLGIISLLIDRNIISKGSFLIIDEPEVHLHPSWQKLLVDSLFEISKKGINIVIATHSIDMMKSIENIVDKNSELVEKEHFGINQLSVEGLSINTGQHVSKKIANIKIDLAKPFLDMFYESQIDLDN